MKSLNQKIILVNSIFKTIALAIFMASAVAAFGAKDHKKTISESFDISNGANVELINKYGNMDIRTIDSDKVNITVEILVDARNEDKAQEVFDRIDIDFYGTSSSVKAETKIDSDKKGFWKNWGSWNNGGNYEIHYFVEVPKHVHLILQNKYGNIFCEDMDNDMDITLKYGNFDIGRAHEVDVDLGYGDGEMTDVHDLDVDLKYGKIEVETAHDVDISSKYSQITIDEAKDIEAESKYDKFRIRKADSFSDDGKYDNLRLGQIGSLKVYTGYTDIDIEKLLRSARIETKYGSIRIDEITDDLDEIDITSSYAGIKINNPEDVGYKFDIETEYASINVDHGTGEFGDDDEDEWARGKRKGKGDGKIKIKSKYGSVRVR